MISKLANFIYLSESWNGKIVFEVSSKLLSKSHFFCPSTSERFSSKQFVLKIETETQHFGSLTPGRNGVKSEYQYQTLSIKLTWVIYQEQMQIFKNFADILGSSGNCVAAKLSCMLLSFLENESQMKWYYSSALHFTENRIPSKPSNDTSLWHWVGKITQFHLAAFPFLRLT